MLQHAERARLGAGPVLACDLDGTLVAGNTFPRFVLFSLWRLLLEGELRGWLRLVAALVRRKLLGAPHLVLKEAVHDVSLLLSTGAVRRWARRLLTRRGHRDVVGIIRDWEGSTVLCTAAPQPYAAHFGELLGMSLVQGSTRRAGRFVENVSTAKAVRLAGVLPQSLAVAITDDADLDGPLLALAGRKLFVDGPGVVTDL